MLLQTQDARLGYALDSRFYGIKSFEEYVRGALQKLTLDDVNQVIQRRLKPGKFQVVVVTKDAEALKQSIAQGQAFADHLQLAEAERDSR